MAKNAHVYSLIFLLAVTWSAFSQTPRQVLDQAYLMAMAENVSLFIDMEIRTQTGEKERKLEIFIRQDESVTKILAQISLPAFLKNMKFRNSSALFSVFPGLFALYGLRSCIDGPVFDGRTVVWEQLG